MVPEIWSMTDNFFLILDHLLPLPPLNNPEIQNFEKMEKRIWRYHYFTLVYHKGKPYDVWFLRYGAKQT